MSDWKQFDPPRVWAIDDKLEVELFWRKKYPRAPKAGSPTIELKATVFHQDGTPLYSVTGSSDSDAGLASLESEIRAEADNIWKSEKWTETKIFRVTT